MTPTVCKACAACEFESKETWAHGHNANAPTIGRDLLFSITRRPEGLCKRRALEANCKVHRRTIARVTKAHGSFDHLETRQASSRVGA